MRRRGLTRVVALVTLVSMLSCEFTAYATEETGNETAQTEDMQEETDTGSADETQAAADEDGDTSESSETYVNERLELNYTNVSKEYTYKEYTGDTVTIPRRSIC